MYPDTGTLIRFALSLALVTSSEAFFLKWGSDSTRPVPQKSWVQSLPPNMSPSYRYQYGYSPYDPRKMYQPYAHDVPQMASIPISVPAGAAGAALTPVSLQQVQLVPCMCPVAPEEADKLQDLGPGPYLAQTYTPASYSIPQQIAVTSDGKTTTNQ